MQLELEIKTKAPEITSAMINDLCSVLKGREWVHARQLRDETPFNDRQLRAIASASEGLIISGQKGYRLFDGRTACEDALQAANWLRSQGAEMIKRSNAILRRYHRFAKP